MVRKVSVIMQMKKLFILLKFVVEWIKEKYLNLLDFIKNGEDEMRIYKLISEFYSYRIKQLESEIIFQFFFYYDICLLNFVQYKMLYFCQIIMFN